MDMDQISAFVAISRLKSFSRAADALHRSQPAISRRIDLLNQELGAPLFERVKVGTLANEAFTAMLRRFRRRHPGVEIGLQTATSQEVSDLVRRGEATLGLRYLADSGSGLVSQTVTRENLVVVASAAHPLAKRRTLRANQLAGQKWVAFRTGTPRESFIRFLNRTLAAAGLDEPEVVAIDSLTAQKRLVEANFGIALLAESGVADELRRGTLRKLKVPAALRTSIPVTAIHRRGAYLSPAARAFLSVLSGRPQ